MASSVMGWRVAPGIGGTRSAPGAELSRFPQGRERHKLRARAVESPAPRHGWK